MITRSSIKALIIKYRRALVVVVQLGLVILSNQIAFLLRFDGSIPGWALETTMRTLPWLVLIRGLVFVPFRLYEGLWRYTGLWDLRNIIAGTLASSVVFLLFLAATFGLRGYPRSVFIVDAVLLVCMLSGIRLTRRLYREIRRPKKAVRVLVYGAGDAGERIVREMWQHRSYDGQAIGFIDDDPDKTGRRIHGVPVLGTSAALRSIMSRYRPDQVLIAIPRADPPLLRKIVRSLQSYKVPIRTLPNLRELMDRQIAIGQIRDLAIEDLLSRPPVGLDPARLSSLLAGRRILVTGAGGSIGSELCRQIMTLGPASLVLLDRYENGLHAIANDLADCGWGASASPVIADVTDAARLDAVFTQYRPEIVFHAAAHKHVPLMELNPCEAVKNNVMGTRLVAEAAERHGAERFILISTDKAVNPTSVMGATKRVAELLVGADRASARMSFVSVRFGNVLGSNGSVFPRFVEQIRGGGPVTVTHEDMRRYFMLIPEAVQLVLHAAALGENGAIYVLDMGDPIRIVDMARDLIRLAGLVPGEDIQIEFTGLRPGEKLSEDLIGYDETPDHSRTEKILKVRGPRVPIARLAFQITALEDLALRGRTAQVLGLLQEMLPSMPPGALEQSIQAAHAAGPVPARTQNPAPLPRALRA